MPTTTNYIWDEDNLLAEADGTNTINTVYTNEPQQYGNLISSRISGTTHYHHYDAMGSTRQLTNATGTVTDSWIYDAWGNVINRTGTTPMPFTWLGMLGYYSDPETGLMVARARVYAPNIARWTARDVMGFVDSLNLYNYVRNRPVRFADPSGKISAEFSRPTDDAFEFLDQVNMFEIMLPGWKVKIDPTAPHVPWETARINVTVNADTSNCKQTEIDVPERGNVFTVKVCCGRITLTFDYSSVLQSLNPSSLIDPGVSGRGFGVEVQGTGFFSDEYYPFKVTKGAWSGDSWNYLLGQNHNNVALLVTH